jgi:hypothetical protein
VTSLKADPEDSWDRNRYDNTSHTARKSIQFNLQPNTKEGAVPESKSCPRHLRPQTSMRVKVENNKHPELKKKFINARPDQYKYLSRGY